MNLDSLTRYAPIGLALLRIVAALLFIEYGTQKFFDFPASGRPGGGGIPPLFMLAGLIEIIGGLLVLVGLFTRYAAFIMSGEMAIAFWLAHVGGSHSIFPIQNHGEAAVLFCFIFLYIFLAGPGAWSVDGQRRPALAAAGAE
jgi:putative oxidoreductase